MYPVDDVSGVVAKELIEETGDVLLLWALEDIGPQPLLPYSFTADGCDRCIRRRVWRKSCG